ncbi:hypothetical protein JW898_04100 [Candidatus Woesearchaeota archaeon]|nr:hypothetical protein [Candidatus Woesearchaeota archaeon]
MRIGKIRMPELGKLRIGDRAREHHRKIHEHIKKVVPQSGEDFGKSIEKKLTASQKIWSNVGIAVFSQKAIENVSHFSSFMLGMFMLLLVDIVLIFPTDRNSLAPASLLTNFFVVLAGLILINAITFVAMKAMGSKTPFKVFFSTVNTALFMSLLVVSIPLALISFALFSTMLKSESAINMFFSLIPFYNYMIYGWGAETLSKLKGLKSILVALIALLLILFFNLLLPQFMA